VGENAKPNELPANRQEPGKKLLKSGRDPSVGKDTQFQPGVSGNPSGRPKRLPITDRTLDQLEGLVPEATRRALGLPKGATYGDAVVRKQVRQAVRGSTQAFNAIADRAEGKPRQAVDFTAEGGIEVVIREIGRGKKEPAPEPEEA
jgi:Family of unknown function (DUF5681)